MYKSLYIAIYNGLFKMADVTIIPFGNAEYKKKTKKGFYKYECQHGDKECFGNIMQNCILDHFYSKKHNKKMNKRKAINALICFDKASFKGHEKKLKEVGKTQFRKANRKCSKEFRWSSKDIEKCT